MFVFDIFGKYFTFVVIADNRMSHIKTNARPLALVFRGEIRFKNFIYDFIRNTATVINNFHTTGKTMPEPCVTTPLLTSRCSRVRRLRELYPEAHSPP